MGRVTIKDVARTAGVSPTAISLAINGKKGISEKTRERILKVVQKMNFIPNESSRRLLFNRTGNIAILMDRDSSLLDQAFYSELNNQVLRECEKQEYNVLYCHAGVAPEGVITMPNVVRSRDMDGIIMMGYLDPRIIRAIHSYEIPAVLVDNFQPEPDLCNVIFDYREAAVVAMQYLVEHGHRRIGYIGSDLEGRMQYFSRQTFNGYRYVLEQHNLAVPGGWMQLGAEDEETAGACMEKILKHEPFPEAVFCSGDIFAIGAMRVIRAAGLCVPEDISVIGIDDIVLSRYVEPSLTTIRVDRQSFASLAVRTLVDRIRHKTTANTVVCSDFQLMERRSVRSIP